MRLEEFEKLVKEGIDSIPKKFLDKLKNVAVCVEDEPDFSQLGKLKSGRADLLGLYEGIPQTERRHYAQVLPDKITIFKKNIERIASSSQEIKEIVRNTVWHEIAHHFGMDEKRVRALERKRKMK